MYVSRSENVQQFKKMCKYNNLIIGSSKHARHKSHNLPSMEYIISTGESMFKTLLRNPGTTNPQLNKSPFHSNVDHEYKREVEELKEIDFDENYNATGSSTRVTNKYQYQCECFNFQLCIMDKRVIFIDFDQVNAKYMIWPLKMCNSNSQPIPTQQTMYAVAKLEYSCCDNEYAIDINISRNLTWMVEIVLNIDKLVAYFDKKLTIGCNDHHNRGVKQYINGKAVFNFSEQFKFYLPKKKETNTDVIHFDPNKEITIHCGKLVKKLKKCVRHQDYNVNMKNNKPGKYNNDLKHSSFCKDIKELECKNIDGLFDLMITNIYDSILYAKLNPSIVARQLYIDRYRCKYYQEFVLLLEIKNFRLNKVHKYGLTVIHCVRDNNNAETMQKLSNNNAKSQISFYSISCVNPAHIALQKCSLTVNDYDIDTLNRLNIMFGDSTKSFYQNYNTFSTHRYHNLLFTLSAISPTSRERSRQDAFSNTLNTFSSTFKYLTRVLGECMINNVWAK